MLDSEEQIESLKRMSSSDRLELAFNLHTFARQRIEYEIRHQNPKLNNKEIISLVNQRFSQ